MVMALLKLEDLSEPYDASDALAVAICHVHTHRFKRAVGVHSETCDPAVSGRFAVYSSEQGFVHPLCLLPRLPEWNL
jgi:hypothetical protein